VSDLNGPAKKAIDQQLFINSPGLRALSKQSRKELREAARARFWDAKQAADQQQQQPSTNNG
jgi:hypothetical protein